MLTLKLIWSTLAYKISFTVGRAILILLVVCSGLFYFKTCKSPIGENKSPIVLTPLPVQTYIKNGEEHEVIKERVYTEKEFKHFADSLKKTINTPGKIQSVIYTVTHVDTVFKPQLFEVDTIDHTITATYEDSDAYIEFVGNSVTKYGNFKLMLVPDTAMYISTFKSHIFKPNEMNIDITHSNHYFVTDKGDAVTFQTPHDFLVFGPVLGYGFDCKTMKFEPFLGVGATINLFNIKIK